MTVGHWLVVRRWPALGISLLLALVAGWGLSGLKFDVRNESYFVEGDPTLQRYHRFLERFRSDEVVYLLLEVPDPFAFEHLTRLAQLGTQLEDLPGVLEVASPLHSPVPAGGGELEFVTAADFDLAQPQERERLAARVRDYRPFQGLFLDEEQGRVGFLVRLESRGDDPSFREGVVDGIREVLSGGPCASYPQAVVGGPVYATEFARILARELSRLLVLGLVVSGVCLLVLFRAAIPVGAPFLVVAAAQVSTLGLMGFSGRPLSTVSSILVTLLICVGVCDAVHVQALFLRQLQAGQQRLQALEQALEETWRPCLLTSLTTGAGFLALLTSKIAPVRDLGVFAALGAFLAFGFTFTLLPALLGLGRAAGGPQPEGDLLERGLGALQTRLSRQPRRWLVGSLLLLGLASLGGQRLYVDHDFLAYLDPDEPLRRDIEFVHERMGGAVTLEVVLDTREENGAASAALLGEVAEFESWVRDTFPQVLSSRSLTQGLEEAHVLFDGPRALPRDDLVLAELLFVLESVDSEFQHQYLTLDGAATRVTLRTEVMGSRRSGELLAKIEAELGRRFPQLSCHITGGAMLIEQMKHYILETQVESFALALGLISLLLFFLARSPGLGMFAVVVNATPVLAVLGLMGWLEIPLEVSNVLVATVAIGIVVDDTIHFLHRYRHERSQGLEVGLAIRNTLAIVGRAIVISTLVLSLNFGTYLFSHLGNVRDFGLLAALTFVLALLADLVLFPVLLILGGQARGA